jgi:glycosyltransferase involved in cell wall biosynthesis
MTAPRVVHVAVSAETLDRLLRSQLEAIRDAGYDVVTMSGPDDHVAHLLGAGIEHVAIPALGAAPSPARDWRALRQLQRAVAAAAPEIVHTHHLKASVLGRIAARRAGVPVMVNTVDDLTTISADDWTRKRRALGERLAASWSDAELVQSVDDLELLRGLGVPDSKLTLIGSGIALDDYDPAAVSVPTRDGRRADVGADAGTVLVGVIGPSADRTCGELLAAASRHADHSQAGHRQSDHSQSGHSQSDHSQSDHRCVFVAMDPDDDVAAAYRALDVVVVAPGRPGAAHASDAALEAATAKLAAMKAAVMGVPLVAEDLALGRVIVDGETGIIVSVDGGLHADRTDALVAAVVRLADDRDLRLRMGAAARARAVTRFDERSVVATTLRTYDWLRNSRCPRVRVGATRATAVS